MVGGVKVPDKAAPVAQFTMVTTAGAYHDSPIPGGGASIAYSKSCTPLFSEELTVVEKVENLTLRQQEVR
jgi:hypothetical protein